jgi:hypothetical protein
MSGALAHFRLIAAAICLDGDVLEEDITFGEVRELLAELDDTRRLLSRLSAQQGLPTLEEVHTRINKAMSDIEESYARLWFNKS